MDSQEIALQLTLKLLDIQSVKDQLQRIAADRREEVAENQAIKVGELYSTIYQAVDRAARDTRK